MKYILLLSLFSILFSVGLNAQDAVGIGTTNPNTKASLDMGQSGKPLILPRLTTTQVNAVNASSENDLGSIIYNTTEHQLYGYMQFRTAQFVPSLRYRWQPIATGPRMLAWGVVDSGTTNVQPKMISGSGNFTITWDASNNSYVLQITTQTYNRDSMMLMVTPVGNGSWDQMVSIENGFSANAGKALIKFTDASRIADPNFTGISIRRRSWFNFTLFDLRKNPYL